MGRYRSLAGVSAAQRMAYQEVMWVRFAQGVPAARLRGITGRGADFGVPARSQLLTAKMGVGVSTPAQYRLLLGTYQSEVFWLNLACESDNTVSRRIERFLEALEKHDKYGFSESQKKDMKDGIDRVEKQALRLPVVGRTGNMLSSADSKAIEELRTEMQAVQLRMTSQTAGGLNSPMDFPVLLNRVDVFIVHGMPGAIRL